MKRNILIILICVLLLVSFTSCSREADNIDEIKILLVIDNEYKKYEYYSEDVIAVVSQKCKEYNWDLQEFYLNIDDNSELTKELSIDYDLVIFTSPSLEAIAVVEAKTHPYTNFILVGANADMGLDNIQDVQNIYSITFKGNEMGFLAGAYAALNMKQGNKICIVGVNEYLENVEYEVGFKCGVKCVNPNISVTHYYTKAETISLEAKEKLINHIGTDCGYIYLVEQNEKIYDIIKELGIPLIEHKYSYHNDTYCIEENIISELEIVLDEFYGGTFKGRIQETGVEENSYCEISDGQVITTDSLSVWENRISEQLIVIPKTRSELSLFSVPAF